MKYLLLVLVMMLTACSAQQDNDQTMDVSQYVEQTCYNTSTQALSASFDEYIDDRKDELNAIRSELTDENFQQLNFALNHFSTYWSKLEVERNQACEQFAACRYIASNASDLSQVQPSPYCDAPRFEYNVSRVKMVTFLNDVASLELQRTPE
ncbi:hypothetical protein A3K86_15820 [Photobacterium jeanii]|uniref:Lysozyme inhibitor LprI N-terminal domain-containing protein n=1 Tax=Photobacterium jeanii TaxID=858640 RepID=A0A178K709_9GAMM|nr:hypothetical protein [Photobacterium jeanii]OAN13129.1 hypothetical protein A3K86_15820 [Photobacterium jeanii]PST89280.1 hypothetical protein C9I91_14265 [Photobacterium jeanii]